MDIGFLKREYEGLLKDGFISFDLYDQYGVKKGLRNNNGTGVLVGLTKVSEVSGYILEEGEKRPKVGELYYRSLELHEVVRLSGNGFGYENACFLLLFGHYPTPEESEIFKNIIRSQYDLPFNFMENIIMKNVSNSLMNHISRAILSLYSFDPDPDNIDPFEIIKKSISIIGKMPAIASYSLQAKTHYIDKDSLTIHYPRKDYSIAENILHLSRNDGKFTELEAKTLDKWLIVHADHGGGNNSAFTGMVVSSSLTDIYSMISASMASLKGMRHGGANIAVLEMMNEVIREVGLDATDDQIRKVILRILDKDFYDRSGLIYGVGHAVYTVSDPRCELLRGEVAKLARENEIHAKKFDIYARFERLAIETMLEKKGKTVSTNVDFYSGFLLHDILRVPNELLTPMFAVARIVGWLSHNIETLLYCNKIIRPAMKYVGM